MKNQQTELDERALKEIISDMVVEADKANKFMAEQKRAMEQKDRIIAEKHAENIRLIANFELKYKTIQVVAPKPDTGPMLLTVAQGMNTIKEVVANQINALLEKKKIFVLPEDGGRHFVKVLRKRFAILASVVVILCFIGWAGLRYWYLNSKNSGFRQVWYWNYMHRDSTGRKRMDAALDSFKMPDVRKERLDSLDQFEARHENKIKALNREADSLKTTN
ncbi:MAG: hypothetical protein JWR09_4697 [Mucilaginibacter sp.]|nr:hypothetical protein [Mucilaginibacter sp.]